MTDIAIEASIEPQEVLGSTLHKTGNYEWDVDIRKTEAVGKPARVQRHGVCSDRTGALRAIMREIEDAL